MRTYIRLTIDADASPAACLEAAAQALAYYKINPPIPEHTDRAAIHEAGRTIGTLTIATTNKDN